MSSGYKFSCLTGSAWKYDMGYAKGSNCLNNAPYHFEGTDSSSCVPYYGYMWIKAIGCSGPVGTAPPIPVVTAPTTTPTKCGILNVISDYFAQLTAFQACTCSKMGGYFDFSLYENYNVSVFILADLIFFSLFVFFCLFVNPCL